jgi:predicted hydrocarbon binding protein
MSTINQKISGKNLLHVKDFIKHRWGKEGLEFFETKTKIDFDIILEDKFYPFNDYIKALENVSEIFNDEKVAFKIGCHRARNLILTKGQPKQQLMILKKIATAWDKFNTFGEIEIVEHTPKKFSVVLSNYEGHPLYCDRTRGFFTGLIKCVLTDSCSVKEVKCVQDGHDVCEFLIEIKK